MRPANDTSVEPKDVNEWCTAIRTALHRRSGKRWSVRHGSGTAYGWIEIKAPGGHDLDDAQAVELQRLLGLREPVHFQGESIAAGNDYRREYLARARGATPMKHGAPYWD